MRALAQIRFRSCLDAGAAEGYKAALVHHLFGAEVTASDLSENACRRAREIFGLTAKAGDVHGLPFEDDEFDVVLCSETLEHVSDVDAAVAELRRVARTAVVITVPHESEHRVEENRSSGEPHAHIHSFSLDSFDRLATEQGIRVVSRPIVSPFTAGLAGFVEGAQRDLREPSEEHRRWNRIVRAHNVVSPITSRVLGKRAESVLLGLDRPACARLTLHRALLFVILEAPSAWSERPMRRVGPSDILSFRVPFFYPPR
jgi:SAM-dependent methyltransferase